MKKSLLFIINPISGIGRQKTIEKHVYNLLKNKNFDIDFAYTKAPKHALEISKSVANKIDIVVAVGGDGTINEVSNGLIFSSTTMGIIPTGSGNGLAKYLKIPTFTDRAIRFLEVAETRTIDTVKINDLFFVNVAGLGFDAEISHDFASFGSRGFKSYLQLITKTIQNYRSKEYSLIINDEEYIKKAFLICFANSSTWGNNAHIAPKAKIDDGKLDIAIIEDFPIAETPILAARLFAQNIHKSKYHKLISSESVIIKNNSLLKMHIDGEPIIFEGDVKIEIIPNSLKVLAKKASARVNRSLIEQLKIGV